MVRKKPRVRVKVIKHEAFPLGKNLYVRMRILAIPLTRLYPKGIKYSLTLINIETSERLVCLDNHGGHGHHLHIKDDIREYPYVDEKQLVKDFWAYAQRFIEENDRKNT